MPRGSYENLPIALFHRLTVKQTPPEWPIFEELASNGKNKVQNSIRQGCNLTN
jgi:hypothetical protein